MTPNEIRGAQPQKKSFYKDHSAYSGPEDLAEFQGKMLQEIAAQLAELNRLLTDMHYSR